ncbi:MAG: TlpA family protein disulfide reductase [Bacteroidales bacterium]|nr:TlpA family protein disulfide reductase [Bacteroidales bacterium]MBR0052426.1 TlpA family protein disulfide reductase [Bacteroidales bacterium]
MRTNLMLLTAALLVVGCTSKSFTLTCDMSPVLAMYQEGSTVDSVLVQYMLPDGEYATLGRAEVTESIVQYSGKIAEPVFGKLKFYLTVPGGTGSSECNLIIEPGNISTDEKLSFYGSKENDAVNAALDKLALCADDPLAVQALFEDFQSKHGDVATTACFAKAISQLGMERWAGMLGSMSDGVRNHPYIKNLSKNVNKELAAQRARDAMSPGAQYKDFQGTWEGKEYKLSDFVSHGKYVLVDFWASWCEPCRKEIPNIIRTYNKYKGKGLEVIGVAVSDKPEETAKAVKKLGINYTVFNETDNSASTAYGIQSIPQILLIGPDGTILKQGLRGESIGEAVKEALGL